MRPRWPDSADAQARAHPGRPVHDGLKTDLHLAADATGGTGEAFALASQVSATWRRFARTGDPPGGLPAWRPRSVSKGETLVIGNCIRLCQTPDQAWLEATSSR